MCWIRCWRGVGRGRASEMVFLVFVDRGAADRGLVAVETNDLPHSLLLPGISLPR